MMLADSPEELEPRLSDLSGYEIHLVEEEDDSLVGVGLTNVPLNVGAPTSKGITSIQDLSGVGVKGKQGG